MIPSASSEISVLPGLYTAVGLVRGGVGRLDKSLCKIAVDPSGTELVRNLCKEVVAVVSSIGNEGRCHYIQYSKIAGNWALNDDSNKIRLCSQGPFTQSMYQDESVDLIIFKTE